jgi:hypothetical protein
MSNSLKRMGMRILDCTVIPAVTYVLDQALSSRDKSIYNMAHWKAMESSLLYIESNMPTVCMLENRTQLLDYAVKRVSVKGTCAEFGVLEGESINYLARKLPEIYGFDSFEGLKEDWKGIFAKGHFDLKGKMPKVAKNVHLIKGWFHETVPEFLKQHPEPFAFAHIDSDTFEAAEIVLNLIGPQFVPGTVLVFDEFFGYRRWELGEFKAWNDYVERTGTEFEYLALTSQRVAIQIRHIP